MLLSLHPQSRCPALTVLEATIGPISSNSVTICYALTGRIADIALPSRRSVIRSNDLWQRTCFEAFVRPAGCLYYYEFNFSPSHEWAAYRFDGYRVGMREAHGINTVKIDVQSNCDAYELRASMSFDDSLALTHATPWHLGLSAVIEETCGRKSYWALAHATIEPDFHHPDCFIHQLFPAAPQ